MSKYVVRATWEDSPHLTGLQKDSLMKSMRPHQRNARIKGVPVLGAGAIYPVDEEAIKCAPFEIPKHWPKSYALDVGWNRTAALWQAWDRESDVVYLYSEHYMAEEKPPVHAAAIKARGAWLRGVVDPASRGRSQEDGQRLFNRYADDLDLKLSFADNSVEAGLDKVWDRMSSGRLKVFSNLSNWFYEFRLYRRDEKGKIVKRDDHLMDALRYLIMSGLDIAQATPGSFGNRQAFTPKHDTDWNPLDQLVRESGLH